MYVRKRRGLHDHDIPYRRSSCHRRKRTTENNFRKIPMSPFEMRDLVGSARSWEWQLKEVKKKKVEPLSTSQREYTLRILERFHMADFQEKNLKYTVWMKEFNTIWLWWELCSIYPDSLGMTYSVRHGSSLESRRIQSKLLKRDQYVSYDTCTENRILGCTSTLGSWSYMAGPTRLMLRTQKTGNICQGIGFEESLSAI